MKLKLDIVYMLPTPHFPRHRGERGGGGYSPADHQHRHRGRVAPTVTRGGGVHYHHPLSILDKESAGFAQVFMLAVFVSHLTTPELG